jgi:hypothetical protein
MLLSLQLGLTVNPNETVIRSVNRFSPMVGLFSDLITAFLVGLLSDPTTDLVTETFLTVIWLHCGFAFTCTQDQKTADSILLHQFRYIAVDPKDRTFTDRMKNENALHEFAKLFGVRRSDNRSSQTS